MKARKTVDGGGGKTGRCGLRCDTPYLPSTDYRIWWSDSKILDRQQAAERVAALGKGRGPAFLPVDDGDYPRDNKAELQGTVDGQQRRAARGNHVFDNR